MTLTAMVLPKPQDAQAAVGKRPGIFRSVQALRGIAAILVVLFHLGVLPRGYMGVDLFFVISGFIMGTVGITERADKFLLNRIIRIAPLYWAVTAFLCICSTVPGLMRSFDFTVEQLLKSLLFIPYTSASGEIWPLVVPGWTLNYEMFFYTLFAMALFTRSPRMTVAMLLCLLAASGMWLKPAAAPLQTYTSPLLLEFALGLAISQWRHRIGWQTAVVLAGAGTTGFVLLLSGAVAAPMDIWQPIVAGGLASMCIAGLLGLEQSGHLRRFGPLPRIGDISYSLYLTHGIIISFLSPFVGRHNPVAIALQFTVALLGAYATYRLFEVPVSAALRRAVRDRPARASG